MQSKKLLNDSVRLFDLAGATAKALAERHTEFRTVEAHLLAAMAWADYTRACHLAMIDAAKHSDKARRFVEQARINRVRAERLLRSCLAPLIAPKSELMKNEDLFDVAGFALSMIP